MQYRRLGRSGLQVSELSLGSWVTYANQVNVKQAKDMLAFAMDSGVNFFDNAEAYASGKSEEVMGDAIKALKWPRLNYIVSTKFYWGLAGPEAKGKDKNHTATNTSVGQCTPNTKRDNPMRPIHTTASGKLTKRDLGQICAVPMTNAVANAAVLSVCPLGKLDPQYQAALHSSGRERPTSTFTI